MSDKKRIRKNYYKNSPAGRRARKKERILLGIKCFSGISVLSIMSVCFIFCHDILTQCDYLNATAIEVSGAYRLSPQHIIDQTGIKTGKNILSVNLAHTRLQLLAQPWIAEAEVFREFPSKIGIKIREHTPLAVLEMGRSFIIDTDGNIFKEWAGSDSILVPEHLPVVSGLTYSDLNEPGKQRSIPFKAVMNALALGNKTAANIPEMMIRRISVDREIGLTVFAFDRVKTIKLGYGNYPVKYDRLKMILKHLKHDGNFPYLETIDLKDLNRIVMRPVYTANQKEV